MGLMPAAGVTAPDMDVPAAPYLHLGVRRGSHGRATKRSGAALRAVPICRCSGGRVVRAPVAEVVYGTFGLINGTIDLVGDLAASSLVG